MLQDPTIPRNTCSSPATGSSSGITASIVSLLWYTDLGEIRLVDLHKDGKPSFRQRIAETFSGIQQRFALEIFRRDGSEFFYSITGQVDDRVKKVIYNFLQQMRSESQS